MQKSWRCRWRELLLLLLSAVPVGLAAITTEAAATGQFAAPSPLVWAPTIALLAVSILLSIRGSTADELLLPLSATLLGFGIAVIQRVNPDLLSRHAVWIIIATVVMGLTLIAPHLVFWLRRYKYTWATLGLVLVAVTIVAGVDPNGSGARLWLGIGGQYFQPSELLKVLLVVFLASYLSERKDVLAVGDVKLGPWRVPSLVHFGPLLALWGISLVLLIAQRDLGATLLFFGVFLVMLYASTSRFTYVNIGLVLFAAAAYLTYLVVPHVQSRVAIWLDPWADPQGTGYQIVQGMLAFASGGVFGVGWGYGQAEMIPASYTDFPLAVIGEQAGLLGTLGVVCLYLLLAARGFTIANRSTAGFNRLLAFGLTAMLCLQAFIIMAGNLRILPLTGITLPFVSYGGSSLLVNCFVLALLLRLSHEAELQKSEEGLAQPPSGGNRFVQERKRDVHSARSSTD